MSFFKRTPRPATPPGTPAWHLNQSLEPYSRPVPDQVEASLTEPESLLGAGSAASLAIWAAALTLSPWLPVSGAFFTVLSVALGGLQVTGWAATIGIGLTSRHRPFRVMGWGTALAVSALYLWKHASGLPPYSFFALAGTLGLAMNFGNVAAWWLSRRRRSGA
jgi:hypothetical protein